MTTWIALFRGINVGGKNILPMAELRAGLESLGLQDVQTYIQSGNALFTSRAKSASNLGKKIAQHVDAENGFRPEVLVLQIEELTAAVQANPFPEAVADPKTLHYFFLTKPAKQPDVAALEALRVEPEEFKLTPKVFYLHTPSMGRSKLAMKIEKHLGVVATARNHRTVTKLIELAAE